MAHHLTHSIDAVMNENINPLREIPKIQRFQIMVFLSLMWATVFSLAIGSWLWWGELVVGHVAVALGILITSLTFQKARAQTRSPAPVGNGRRG